LDVWVQSSFNNKQSMYVITSDLAVYGAHAVFWGAFIVTRLVTREPASSPKAAVRDTAVAREETTARHSRGLLAFHMAAFGITYYGIARGVFGRMPALFVGLPWLGAATLAVGLFLAVWSLLYFKSWRFRAQLDEGHQLATGGPFRFLRHPIYMGLNLLALGSALWIPNAIMWAGVVLMVVGSDLRARAEERVLAAAFGSAYRDYCGRTPRFVPGIY